MIEKREWVYAAILGAMLVFGVIFHERQAARIAEVEESSAHYLIEQIAECDKTIKATEVLRNKYQARLGDLRGDESEGEIEFLEFRDGPEVLFVIEGDSG